MAPCIIVNAQKIRYLECYFILKEQNFHFVQRTKFVLWFSLLNCIVYKRNYVKYWLRQQYQTTKALLTSSIYEHQFILRFSCRPTIDWHYSHATFYVNLCQQVVLQLFLFYTSVSFSNDNQIHLGRWQSTVKECYYLIICLEVMNN